MFWVRVEQASLMKEIGKCQVQEYKYSHFQIYNYVSRKLVIIENAMYMLF